MLKDGKYMSEKYLILFFENLLFDKQNKLDNDVSKLA